MRLIVALLAGIGAHLMVVPGRPTSVPFPRSSTAALVGGVFAVSMTLGAPIGLSGGLGIIAGAVPVLVERSRARRRASEARDQWPDFLAIVRSRIGSGQPLPDAVRAAARLLGGPFLDLDRAWGGSFPAELEAVRRDWSDPVSDRVLTTLRIAAATGGAHVDAVLSSLASSLSEDMRIRTAHEAALTQQRMTAGVALVAPWVILVLSLATNPQAGAEFATPTGRAVLVGGGVATVTGFVLARRASRLSAPPRVFA